MARLQTKKSTFPWRKGHHLQLYVDGDEIFSAMLAAIAAARSLVLLEMYLVESGVLMSRVLDALDAAVRRNVEIYLLFDDFGARGLQESDRVRIRRANPNCAFFNPLRYGELRRNLLRDHRKLMVVDGELAIIGGFGITDNFDQAQAGGRYWHDVAMRIQGPVVADWTSVFFHNWKYWSRREVALAADMPVAAVRGGAPARVVCGSRLGAASDIQRNFIRRAAVARQRVWWMTAYFVPSIRLRHVLRGAARRGVDVRLLLPGPITDHPGVRFAGRRFYASLLSAGVRIYEYQPRFLHGKLMLCDGWVSLGSSNMDRWNLRWNLEANQEVDDADFARQVHELFARDFARSEECLFGDWQQRSLYYRWREWFWGRIDMLLDVVGRWLRR